MARILVRCWEESWCLRCWLEIGQILVWVDGELCFRSKWAYRLITLKCMSFAVLRYGRYMLLESKLKCKYAKIINLYFFSNYKSNDISDVNNTSMDRNLIDNINYYHYFSWSVVQSLVQAAKANMLISIAIWAPLTLWKSKLLNTIRNMAVVKVPSQNLIYNTSISIR